MVATTSISDPPGPHGTGLAVLPGVALAVLIATVAVALGSLAPVVGAPVIGIVMGVLLSQVLGRKHAARPGIALASGRGLQLAVVLLGSQLSMRQVLDVGAHSLPVMLATLAACLAMGEFVGRRLAIKRDLRILISVGTGICGASAIAAVSPVIRARGNDITYAVSTIFVFNVLAVLTFPPIGHLLGMSQNAFGLFAGTAVNDTSSVVAAATSFGTAAANYAVVVKLTRTLMIIPITLVIAALTGRRGNEMTSAHRTFHRTLRLVPWFLIGFLVVVVINTAGWIPASTHGPLGEACVFLITVALAAIGLSTDFGGLRRAGSRPLLLGLMLWLTVAATSVGLQALAR